MILSKRYMITAAIALALAVTAVIYAQAPAGSESVVTPTELSKQLEGETSPLILDVRSREEFARGHIPGAVNIPYRELGERLSELDAATDRDIVVHCETGPRARVGESVLRDAGYHNIQQLEGHMAAWRERDLPISRP